MTTWVLQSSGIDDHNTTKLFEALEGQNIPFKDVGVIPFTDRLPGIELIDPDDRNIFYGSTKLIKLIGAHKEFTPGVWYDPDTFNVDAWSTHHGGDMLNAHPSVMPISKFLQWSFPNDRMFVRPFSDLKDFSGGVVEKTSRRKWFEELSYGTIPVEQLVAVSPVRELEKEWRFVVRNNGVIAGSQYRSNGVLNTKDRVALMAWVNADIFASRWMPAPVVMMDVALVDNDFKIIEFNCFNASGFYDCDLDMIVEEVTDFVDSDPWAT